VGFLTLKREEKKMEKKIYLQQGDVILYQVDTVPTKAKEVEIISDSFVVEKGEGVNTHELRKKGLQRAVSVYETENECFFQVKQEVELFHKEHGVFVLEPNMTLMKQKEREWDYEKEESRLTMD